MKRFALVVAIAACGSKPDAPPPAPAPAPAQSAPTALPIGKIQPLAEATRSATSNLDFIALAHAMIAQKNPIGARAALARMETTNNFDDVLMRLDVLQLLGEDHIAEMKAAAKLRPLLVRQVARAFETVESPVAIDVATQAVPAYEDFDRITSELALDGALVPGTPRWDKLVTAVATDADKTLLLARLARWRHAAEVAHALVLASAKLAPSTDVVDELFLEEDRAQALEMLARVPAATGTGLPRAEALEERAFVEAELGNMTEAAALHARSTATSVPELSGALILLTALYEQMRGVFKPASFARRHVAVETVAALCVVLGDHGWRDEAIELAKSTRSLDAFEAIARLDVLRGNLPVARKLAADEGLDAWSTVLQAYAQLGDVSTVADIARRSEHAQLVGVSQLAQTFAKKGDCTRATEFAINAPDAYTYAVVARYCP